jgi:hypothetical protein
MNTAHFVKAFTPTALGLTVAGVATPVLLFLVFLGRGSRAGGLAPVRRPADARRM